MRIMFHRHRLIVWITSITILFVLDSRNTIYCMPTDITTSIRTGQKQEELRTTTLNNPEAAIMEHKFNRKLQENNSNHINSSEYATKGEFCVILCRTNPAEGGKMCSCDSYPMACKFNCTQRKGKIYHSIGN